MGFLRTAFTTLKRVPTGEVIRQIDTPIMQGTCTISLRLKRKEGATEPYVVLAALASGNYQYLPMDAAEFERLRALCRTSEAT